MRIADIAAIPVEIGIKSLGDGLGVAPYVTGYETGAVYDAGQVKTTKRLLIRLETADGTVGWGETWPTPSPASAKVIVDDVVAPKIVGRKLWETEDIADVFEHAYMSLDAFRGGIEMAMWDALGKSFEAPLHELIGGKCIDAVDIAFCLGILDQEQSQEYASMALDNGFSVLKTKGGRQWKDDIERVIAMHDAVDGQLEFRIDGNQAWTYEQAVRVGAKLEDAGVYVQYLEQPVRVSAFGAYKRLRERLRQPIGVNEDMYHRHNLFNLVREDAIDVAVIDLVPAGGINAAKRLASVAAEAGVSVTHHSSFDLGIKTAAVLHLAASTPAINLAPDRVNYSLVDDVIESRFEVENGSFSVPDGPGLGVTVDERKVDEYRIDV